MSVQQPGRPEWSLVKQVVVFGVALSGAAVLGVVLANAATAWTQGGATPGGQKSASRGGSSGRPGNGSQDTGRCIPCEEKNPPLP
jgi:hypothetical protein